MFLFVGLLLMSSCERQEESLLFIGDSLIYEWDILRSFPSSNVVNLGVPGAQIGDIQTWNIDSRGKTIVLLIGTNNLPHLNLEEPFSNNFTNSFVNSYLDVIQTFNANKIIAISILPRHKDMESKLYNKEIEKINEQLANALSFDSHIVFLNAYDLFLKEGDINLVYFKDGLHLNHLGYELLTQLVKEKL